MKTTPARECSKAFDQYIRFVARYKLRGEVLRRLNAKLQSPVQASDVHRWLHPDPKSRTEPRWGTGTLLLAVWEEMVMEITKKREGEGWIWWPMHDPTMGPFRLVPVAHLNPWMNHTKNQRSERRTEWFTLPYGNQVPTWIFDP